MIRLFAFIIALAFPSRICNSVDLEFNAGIQLPNSTVTHEYEFTNTSDSNAVVSDIRLSCSCISTNLEENALPPKGRIKFSVSFQTSPFAGPEIGKITFAVTTGERKETHTATLTTRTMDYLSTPAGPFRIPADGEIGFDLIKTEHPDTWTEMKAIPINSEGKISFSVAKKSADTWRVSAKTINGMHTGVFRSLAALEFYDNGARLEHGMKLQFSSAVPGSIKVTPPFIVIGGVMPGESIDASAVLSYGAKLPSPTVSSLSSSDPERVSVSLSVSSDNRQILVLKFTASGAEGHASGEALIHLDNGEIFHIPYAASILKK